MNRDIKDSRDNKKIRLEPADQKVDPDDVGRALGADPIPVPTQKMESLSSLLALHGQMSAELQSSGGRPSRPGTNVRRKIPMAEQEWNDLEHVADLLSSIGLKTSPGQVAGFLLENSLREITEEIREIEQDTDQVLEAAADSKSELHELQPVAAELLRRVMLRKIAERFGGFREPEECNGS